MTDPAPTDNTVPDPTPVDPQPAPTNDQTPPVDQQTAQTNESAPADTPAPVVATDATITDWSDPTPTDSLFKVGGNPLPTVVSYRYCIWTYSDGSTQQKTYETKYATADGSLNSTAVATFECSIATAP